MEESLNISLIFYLGTSVMLMLTVFIVLFIYLYQRKIIKKQLAYQKVEDLLKKQELKSAYAMLEGKDQERKRIAEELHDNLGNILVSLNMYLDTYLSSADENRKKTIIQRVRDLTSQASEETRKLSHRLDAVALKHFGLSAALNELFQTLEETQSIRVKKSLLVDDKFENEIAFNLYRIIQELVNNTLKHSQAKTISLELNQIRSEYISLIYQDDGVGFDPGSNYVGLGLKNIRSRVEVFNGDLSIEPLKKGVSFIIEIPLS